MTTIENIKNDIRQIKFLSTYLHEFNREEKEELLVFLKNFRIQREFEQFMETETLLTLRKLIFQNDKLLLENYTSLLKTLGILREGGNEDFLIFSFDIFCNQQIMKIEEDYHHHTNKIFHDITEQIRSKFNSIKESMISNEQKFRDLTLNLIEQHILKKNELFNCFSLYHKTLQTLKDEINRNINEYDYSSINNKQNDIYTCADEIDRLKNSFPFFIEKKIESAVLIWRENIKDYYYTILTYEIIKHQYDLIRIIQDEVENLIRELDEIVYIINEKIHLLEKFFYQEEREQRNIDVKQSYLEIIDRLCETDPSPTQSRGYCSCHDGSLVPLIIKKNLNNNYDIFSLSDVLGMGMGEYNNKIFENDFSDYFILNNFSGVSYVCIRKQLWGLLKLEQDSKSTNFFGVRWELVSDFTYSTVDELLNYYGIDKTNFHV